MIAEPPLLASGAGVRVAVVDSGVDGAHPAFAGARLSHFAVVKKGETFDVERGEPVDRSGHGTPCAGIIHRMVPDAEIVSICALGSDGRGSREGLLAALRFAVRERYDVVSCSLGIDFPRSAPLRPIDQKSIVELYELADAAYVASVVLCASGPNVSQVRTVPARFKSIVGVGRAGFTDPEMLASEITADHEIVAPGVDVVAPALGGGERRFTGTSFACPHVSAHLARIRAARRDMGIDEVKAALHALARARAPRANAPPAPPAPPTPHAPQNDRAEGAQHAPA